PGQDPKQRRLAGAARAEDDEDLVVAHGQRQPLERCRVPAGGLVDPEQVTGVDGRRRHAAASAVEATGARKAAHVAIPTSAAAASKNGGTASPNVAQSRSSRSGGTGVSAPAVRRTTPTTSVLSTAPVASPPTRPTVATIPARRRSRRRRSAGAAPCASSSC